MSPEAQTLQGGKHVDVCEGVLTHAAIYNLLQLLLPPSKQILYETLHNRLTLIELFTEYTQ